MAHDPSTLPADLPAPSDDGAARHLLGLTVPSIVLRSTSGEDVDLREQSVRGRLVVFTYPRTGRPGVEPPSGWDSIPGARGCTPEACSFRDLAGEFAAHDTTIYGVSTQDTEYQREAASRLRLPYALLSDQHLRLSNALRLPTFDVEGMTLLRRATLLLSEGRVKSVLYPVFPPDQAASQALSLVAPPSTPRGDRSGAPDGS
ncbi:MAG: peroxiredoxin [Actinomycetota bacterium]|nr:peroxiredoxin [Actinomycetota bacterium]